MKRVVIIDRSVNDQAESSALEDELNKLYELGYTITSSRHYEVQVAGARLFCFFAVMERSWVP